MIIAGVNEDITMIQEDTMRQLPVSKKDIQIMTEEDSELRELSEIIKKGFWPKVKPGSNWNAFQSKATDLTLHDGILFMGVRAVIPKKLQQRILRMLHQGHPGITRMKMLARQSVYWHGIDRDIESMVKTCDACQKAAKMPIKNTLSPWPEPSQAWERIHIDFAGPMENSMFLVVVDAYSKWPEIIQMSAATSTTTIRELNRMFARYGFPKTLVSDNGTQFTSMEFERFCQSKFISHIRIPPFHPQSNGQAERFVDTFKRTIQKLKGEGITEELVQKFLLCYRSTPCPSSPNQKSPAEIFLGRQIRTPLSDLQLSTKKDEKHSEKKSCMKRQFDKRNGARPRVFKEQDAVYARDYKNPNHPRWIPGKILKRIGKTVYEVEIDRRITKRHTNQLRPRNLDWALKEMFETFDMPVPLQDKSDGEKAPVRIVFPGEEEMLEPDINATPRVTENEDGENRQGDHVPSHMDNEVNPEELTHIPTGIEPEARPKRYCNPPKRIVLDPSRKSYDFL